jgi:hypothetical protein
MARNHGWRDADRPPHEVWYVIHWLPKDSLVPRCGIPISCKFEERYTRVFK